MSVSTETMAISMIAAKEKVLNAGIIIRTLSVRFLSKRLTLNHEARNRRIIISDSMNTRSMMKK